MSQRSLCDKVLTVEEDELTQSYNKRYATSIKRSIWSRFPKEMLSVTSAFSIFNIEDFPSNQNSQQFKVYGLENIAQLQSHYQDDEKEVENKWSDCQFEM